MRRVNLLPAYRIRARERGARARRWVGACAACGALVVAALVGARAVRGDEDRRLAAETQRLTREVATLERAHAALVPQAAEAQADLDANLSITAQPDWSLLLAMVSLSLDEEVVLNACELEVAAPLAAAPSVAAPAPAAPARGGKPPPAAAAPRPEVGPVLRVGGFGRSQGSVAQFALRLEQTGLFDRVSMMKANREPFLAGEATAFRIDCALKARARRAP